MYELIGSANGGMTFEQVKTFKTFEQAKEYAEKKGYAGIWRMTFGEEGYAIRTPEGEEIDL